MTSDRPAAPIGGVRRAAPPGAGPPGGYGLDLPPGVEPPREPGSGPPDPLAHASLLLGFGSVLFGWCCAFLGPLLAIGAVVTGSIALTRIGQPPVGYAGRGAAIVGISLGSLSLIATGVWVTIWLMNLP